MLFTLIQKELKSIILSPKFAVTFGICAFLILLSVFTGISEYRAAVDGWETNVRLADDQVRETNNWSHMSYRAMRKPEPLMVFVSGLSSDIGRWSRISGQEGVKLRNSAYSDDPIFAVFRMIDFAFIVQIVLSLLAILFTYDAVSGERESGTLKLIFANSVPRATYLLGKCIGSWLGLVVPVLIPILLGVLVVMFSNVPLTSMDWARLATLVSVALLFFSLFIVLGVLISTLTRRSSVSFLVSLVVWVAFVLIIPRAGMMAAGQMVQVPRVAEIESQRDGYAKGLWSKFYEEMEQNFRRNRENRTEEPSEEEMWAQMEMQDSLRELVETDINKFEIKLHDDLRLRKASQERLAFTLSRFSPASAFQLAAMTLCGTDVDMKRRYQESMTHYRDDLMEYAKMKGREADGPGGGFVKVEIDSEKGVTIGTGRDEPVDVSDMPRFEPPTLSYAQVLMPVMTDIGILGIGTLLIFLGAFFAFLRYDVR